MRRRYRRFGIALVAVLLLAVLAASARDIWISEHADPLPLVDERADMILIEKSERRLTLFREGAVLATYMVALGSSPYRDKEREGDGRTPEGRYTINARNSASRFHLSLRISYPDASDSEQAAAAGVSPGGDIMIHGLRNGMGWIGGMHRLWDWTDGCIAVTNREIEEIWARADVGTPVEIRP